MKKRYLVLWVGHWTPDDIKQFEDSKFLFLYGDNVEGYGKGGQACIRGMKNTYGIPTKWRSGKDKEDYFTDEDEGVLHIFNAINSLPEDVILVMSEDGLGTGLAELDKRAPATYNAMIEKLNSMIDNPFLEYK